jgi:hypothetical protein
MAGTQVESAIRSCSSTPQQQRDAFARQAEVATLDGEIEKRRAEQAAAEAKDRTELVAVEHDVERARLEVRKNELIPRIEAEKNTLALVQATEKLEQVRLTFGLKRQAAAADLRILEIRRERADRALRYAEQNAQLMTIAAPFSGLVVIQRLYRNGSFVEIARGDEVRPGAPIVDIVDTSACGSTRASIRPTSASCTGQRADRTRQVPRLTFDGESLVARSPRPVSCRRRSSFVAIVSIAGSPAAAARSGRVGRLFPTNARRIA